MGNDAPLACLSEFQPLLYDYFKQLFAQVKSIQSIQSIKSIKSILHNSSIQQDSIYVIR